MQQRPSLAWWALVITGIAALAAIWFWWEPGEKEQSSPSRTPGPTTRTDASSEPTHSAPPLPAEAKENTTSGAEAFTKYYFELLNFATSQNNTTEIKKFYEPSCEICNIELRQIENTERDQLKLVGGQYSTSQLKGSFVENSYLITFTVRRAPSRLVDTGGKEVEGLGNDIPASDAFMQLTWRNESFLIRTYGLNE